MIMKHEMNKTSNKQTNAELLDCLSFASMFSTSAVFKAQLPLTLSVGKYFWGNTSIGIKVKAERLNLEKGQSGLSLVLALELVGHNDV